MKIKTAFYFLFISLIIFSLTACQTQTTATPTASVQVTASPEQTINIGVISDDRLGQLKSSSP